MRMCMYARAFHETNEYKRCCDSHIARCIMIMLLHRLFRGIKFFRPRTRTHPSLFIYPHTRWMHRIILSENKHVRASISSFGFLEAFPSLDKSKNIFTAVYSYLVLYLRVCDLLRNISLTKREKRKSICIVLFMSLVFNVSMYRSPITAFVYPDF